MYKNIPLDVQNRIDNCVRFNIKKYIQPKLLFEVKKNYKQKLIHFCLNFDKIYFNYSFGYDILLNDILFWLNEPYSQNMDTPFMSGLITDYAVTVFKRVNNTIPDINFLDDEGIYMNNNVLKYIFNSTDKKYIVFRILYNLSINELETYILYKMSHISKKTIDNVYSITHYGFI